jgi:hypothetical protein
MGRRAVDMLGRRFGRLVVVGRHPLSEHASGAAAWECRCDCGAKVRAVGSDLRRGDVISGSVHDLRHIFS